MFSSLEQSTISAASHDADLDESQAWAARTQADVDSVRSLAREVPAQLSRNDSIVLDEKYASSVQALFKGKMSDTISLTERLKEEVCRVDNMLKKLRESHCKLQGAQGAKWAPLKAVSRRLETHLHREERSNEGSGDARIRREIKEMEIEKQAYAEARQQLSAGMTLTKEQTRLLRDIKEELHDDMHGKRRSYRIDHLSLLDGGHRTDLAAEEVVRAPRLTEVLVERPTSPQRADPGTGNNNDEVWKDQTKALLAKAKRVLEDCDRRLRENDEMILVTSQTCKGASDRTLCSTFDSVATLTGLTQMLKEEVLKIDGMLKHLRESHAKLQRDHSAKWAPLCVVSRRLEIRSRRPLQECRHDQFQTNAETEREEYSGARAQLLDAMQRTKEQMKPLYGIKQELFDDLAGKRRSHRIDHLSLLDDGHGGRRTDLLAEEVVRRPLSTDASALQSASPQSAEQGFENSNEEVWKMQTKALIAKADQILGDREQRLRLNVDILTVTDQNCRMASNRTQKSMNDNVLTLTSQKRALEEEVSETQKIIDSTCTSLGSTARRLKQHEGPLQSIRRQFMLRQQRAEREDVRDPAHEVLEEHLSAVKKTVQSLSSQAGDTEKVVHDLKAMKERLQEALKLKTIALRLDVSCTKVTQKNVSALYMATATLQKPRCRSHSPPRHVANGKAAYSRHAGGLAAASSHRSSSNTPSSPSRGLRDPPLSSRVRLQFQQKEVVA